MTKRAAVYVRLSRYRGDDDPTTSPERQREAGEAYAMAQGWEVVDVVEDLDVSGGRMDRPGLNALRERFAEVDAVIFLKLDRLARNVAGFSAFAEEARAAGVALVSVRDGLDLSTPGGRFVAQILAAFAEMELATITERTRDGKRKAKELGRWQGGPVPYGYRRTAPGVVEIDEAEAAALRTAAELLTTQSAGAAVRYLQRTFPPRRAERWRENSLRGALLRPTTAEILGPGLLELVRETYDARRGQARPVTSHPKGLLSALLRCAECDSPMYLDSHRRPMYRCSNTLHCPRRMSIAAEPIDAWVEERYLAAFSEIEETRPVRAADARLARITVLAEEVAERRAALSALPAADLAAEAVRLAAAETELAALREQRRTALVVATPTGRTLGEAWRGAAEPERRAAVLESLQPSGSLTIGPGRRGPKGLQEERILDRWKVEAWNDEDPASREGDGAVGESLDASGRVREMRPPVPGASHSERAGLRR